MEKEYGSFPAILAFPCDKPLVLSQEQGEEILAGIEGTSPMNQEEKKKLSDEVAKLFRKPIKNGQN